MLGLKKLWPRQKQVQTPLLEVSSQTALRESLKKDFTRSSYGDRCRTLSFTSLGDGHEYYFVAVAHTPEQWAIQKYDKLPGESVFILTTTQDHDGKTRFFTFFEAVEKLAELQKRAGENEIVLDAPTAEELGQSYFRNLALLEGIVFESDEGKPQPTQDGKIVIDGAYDEEMMQWAHKHRTVTELKSDWQADALRMLSEKVESHDTYDIVTKTRAEAKWLEELYNKLNAFWIIADRMICNHHAGKHYQRYIDFPAGADCNSISRCSLSKYDLTINKDGSFTVKWSFIDSITQSMEWHCNPADLPAKDFLSQGYPKSLRDTIRYCRIFYALLHARYDDEEVDAMAKIIEREALKIGLSKTEAAKLKACTLTKDFPALPPFLKCTVKELEKAVESAKHQVAHTERVSFGGLEIYF